MGMLILTWAYIVLPFVFHLSDIVTKGHQQKSYMLTSSCILHSLKWPSISSQLSRPFLRNETMISSVLTVGHIGKKSPPNERWGERCSLHALGPVMEYVLQYIAFSICFYWNAYLLLQWHCLDILVICQRVPLVACVSTVLDSLLQRTPLP